MDYLSILKDIPDLHDVPESELKWLIHHAQFIELKSGDFIFKPGDPINKLHIIMDGVIALKYVQNGQQQIVAQFEKGSITSLLPCSRASVSQGYGEAVESAVLLQLDKSFFPEMIRDQHELTTAFVHVMSSRIRTFTKQRQQNEKMMALGKLSAGLAHELNNPSAAVVRSAQELSKHLGFQPEAFKRVIKVTMEDETVDAVNNILFSHIKDGPVKLSMMDRTELEDNLLDWLDDNDIDGSEEMAEDFVEYGIGEDEMEKVKDLVGEEDLQPVLRWYKQLLTTEKLVSEIRDASQRINDLVTCIKGYTHMDRGSEKHKTDLHDGIRSTITMLNHKFRKMNIELEENFTDGPLEAHVLPSEMNQVWTNLIDNAIDAM